MTKNNPITGKEILRLMAYFLSFKFLTFFIAWLSNLVFLKSIYYETIPGNVFQAFLSWDTGWYLSIVNVGYYYNPGGTTNTVFFPLYPLLVKLFTFIVPDPILCGYLISNTACMLGVVYLYKLVKIDYNEQISLEAAIFYLIFPTSFFTSIFYTESLFFLFVTVCIYYTRRKMWLAASVFGLVASMTRNTGFLLLIPMLIEYFDINLGSLKLDFKKLRMNICWLLLVPSGLISYMVYLYIKFNEPFAFIKGQKNWGKRLVYFVDTFWSLDGYGLFHKVIFISFVLIMLTMLFYLFYKKIRLSYTVYALVTFILLISSGTLESMPRFAAMIFPFYIGYALMAQNRVTGEALKFLSIGLLILFVSLFVNGYWLT